MIAAKRGDFTKKSTWLKFQKPTGHLNTWIVEYLNTQILEYLNTRILEYRDTWLHELDLINRTFDEWLTSNFTPTGSKMWNPRACCNVQSVGKVMSNNRTWCLDVLIVASIHISLFSTRGYPIWGEKNYKQSLVGIKTYTPIQDMITACLLIILFTGAYVLQDKYTNSKHSVPKTSSKPINVNAT